MIRPPEEPAAPGPLLVMSAGYHFRPSSTIDGRSAIDLWKGAELVATIYAQRGGVHLVCAQGFATGALTVEIAEPHGVVIGLEERR